MGFQIMFTKKTTIKSVLHNILDRWTDTGLMLEHGLGVWEWEEH